MAKKKTVARVAFAVVGIAVLATAIYIMANGLGLQDDLDFGAGARTTSILGPGPIIMPISPILKNMSTGIHTPLPFLSGFMYYCSWYGAR